jgi:hypothetical protein
MRMEVGNEPRKRFFVYILKYDESKDKYKISAIEPEILGGMKKWTFI